MKTKFCKEGMSLKEYIDILCKRCVYKSVLTSKAIEEYAKNHHITTVDATELYKNASILVKEIKELTKNLT